MNGIQDSQHKEQHPLFTVYTKVIPSVSKPWKVDSQIIAYMAALIEIMLAFYLYSQTVRLYGGAWVGTYLVNNK